MYTSKFNNLFEIENSVNNALNSMIGNNQQLDQAYEVFYEVYNYLLSNYYELIQKFSFYSTNKLSKELVEDKNYFRKNPARLTQNLQTILTVINDIKSSMISSPDFYLSKLVVSNYRIFNSYEIDFTFYRGVNLIVGNNGTGKTSILDAIHYLLARLLKAMSFTTKKLDIIRETEEKNTLIFGEFYYNDGILVEEINNDYYSMKNSNLYARNMLYELGKIQKHSSHVAHFPIVAYYSIATGTNDYIYKKQIPLHLQGYIGCLNGGANLKETTKWLKRTNSDKINCFLDTINLFIIKMEDGNKDKNIIWNENKSELIFNKNGKPIPIEKLSSGYKQIIHLIIDLTFRAVSLNPHIDSMSKVSGIVLIDEIDLHLHPKWQWNVIPTLKSIFPKIQFIITTHSPFVVSSCDSDRILVISDNQRCYVGKQYGSSIQKIVESVLGTKTIPQKLDKMFSSFEEALHKEQYEQAESLLSQMKNEYGDNSDIVKEAIWNYELDFDEEENI